MELGVEQLKWKLRGISNKLGLAVDYIDRAAYRSSRTSDSQAVVDLLLKTSNELFMQQVEIRQWIDKLDTATPEERNTIEKTADAYYKSSTPLFDGLD